MTFQEWNIRLFRGPILGELIPMELKRTFPRFSVEEGQMCASFVGFRTNISDAEIKISKPRYYLKVTYPQGKIQSFERFSSIDITYHHPESCDSQAISNLRNLGDRVLRMFDEKSSDLESAISEYNSLLDTLLEADQLATIKQYAGPEF